MFGFFVSMIFIIIFALIGFQENVLELKSLLNISYVIN